MIYITYIDLDYNIDLDDLDYLDYNIAYRDDDLYYLDYNIAMMIYIIQIMDLDD